MDKNSRPCEELLLESRSKTENMSDEEKVSAELSTGKDLELSHLEEELDLLKEAVRMVQDPELSTSTYTEQLNEQIKARRHNLQKLESERDAFLKSLEEKRRNLLESFCGKNTDSQLKLQKLEEIELEMHSVIFETKKREEECVRLACDLDKHSKVASRRSYIQRITEITKNSRKLDADINSILKETRELKLASNSIEERLHRTYTVACETVSRGVKKDSVGHQAYKLLTSIHETFETIREKILATDKARREAAELEAKLSVIASRSSDMSKLQADLDAMRMENERLEKALQNHHCGKSN